MPSLQDIDGFIVSYSSAAQESPIYGEKTMWDLVTQSSKATKYANQREEFEFTWNPIVGYIDLVKLRLPQFQGKGDALSNSNLASEEFDSPQSFFSYI